MNRGAPSLERGSLIRLGTAEARVLFTEEDVRTKVRAMALSLRERLEGDCPVFIGLLHGGFVFLADLIREYGAPHEVDFLKVSRYDLSQKDPTAVRVMHDLRSNIKGRNVVVVEGIRAKGTKIEYVDRFLRLHQPRTVEYCAMVRPAEANVVVPMSQVGFEIDREFVVGYGLDYREQYRHLAFISAYPTPQMEHRPDLS
jgi:hypoxanthine phosphoribosyltransferase